MFLSIVVVVLLLIVFYRFALKGKVGHFPAGIGNALFQAHTFVRPIAHNIVEAKKSGNRTRSKAMTVRRTFHPGRNQASDAT